MYKVHAVKKPGGTLNTWPPSARPIRRQGRAGKNPRPVVCVRIKAPGRLSR